MDTCNKVKFNNVANWAFKAKQMVIYLKMINVQVILNLKIMLIILKMGCIYLEMVILLLIGWEEDLQLEHYKLTHVIKLNLIMLLTLPKIAQQMITYLKAMNVQVISKYKDGEKENIWICIHLGTRMDQDKFEYCQEYK